ncbi:DUF3857 domain-containing protein [Sanyastnella coralliicola]|uniref:DUF3857 domain-containing protein n=1 Tax=Sanyastnella coralliicola TaxID=3069118 RepID=UPI0027BA46B8|nr:DUF3857 domain-containing protein [Longitalea sp. SCSIO 12813]
MKTIYNYLLISLLTITGSVSALAQFDYEDYDWKEEAVLTDMPEGVENEGAFFTKYHSFRELLLTEKGYPIERYTVHYIRKVVTEEAIENENKIYYLSNESENVVTQKARVIRPDGEVRLIGTDELVTAENEETGQTQRYFALEGLEPGSDVEYILQVLRFPSQNGVIIYFQGSEPKFDYNFELIYPQGLGYTWKTLNTDQEAKVDTSEFTAKMQFKFDEIPALEPESNAAYDPYRQGVVYKMMYNEYIGTRDLVSFRNVSKFMYEAYMGERDKKDLKAVAKLLKKTEVDEAESEEDKIHRLDRWIKQNIQIVNADVEELSDVQRVCVNFVANETGITSLYATAFALLEIPFEMMVTSNRFDVTFDEDFENYSYLNEVYFYFDQHEKYLDPVDMESYLGMINSAATGGKALFVKELEAGGIKTGMSEVREVPLMDMEETMDVMNIEMSIDLDNETVELTYEKSSSGYYAANYQPYMPLVNDETKEEIREIMVNWISEDIDIKRNEVDNIEMYDFGQVPLKQSFDVSCEEFLASAGDKLLCKIGLVIGPQAEMYSEEERKLPVDGGYKHAYDREIVFNIPDGFTVENMDDLKMDVRYGEKEGGIGFVSDYVYDESAGTITVSIEEYYDKVFFEVAEYEEYSAVINAAADFNKIVLVLRES